MISKAFVISTLHNAHPSLRAEDWRSPLIRRLIKSDNYCETPHTVTLDFQNDQCPSEVASYRCTWTGLGPDFVKCINTYQAPVITEFATLGMACLLVEHKLGKSITEVTRRGEKADYWIGERESMLEVSGQQSGNLDTLHAAKTTQLRENPFGKDGWVCVASYDSAKIIFYFHTYVP